jgi:hypothetical protein
MNNKAEMVSAPRELLEGLLQCAALSPSAPYRQLRALLAAPAEDVCAVVDEPIQVVAVAVTREDDEGCLYLDWLLEGGISELEFEGTVLFAMPEANGLCDEDGSAEIYRRAKRPVVMPERELYTKYMRGMVPGNAKEVSDWKDGWNACLDEFKRLNP